MALSSIEAGSLASSSSALNGEREAEEALGSTRGGNASSELSSGDEETNEESDLSSLTDEEEEEEEEEGLARASGVGSVNTLRDLTKVAITPHRRAEKRDGSGRPTRRTAAAASTAWSRLTPRAYRRRSGLFDDDDDDDDDDQDESEDLVDEATDTPTKRKKIAPTREAAVASVTTTPRKRGRPPKNRTDSDVTQTTPRKVGRPRKENVNDEPSSLKRVKLSDLNAEELTKHLSQDDHASLIKPTSSDAYFAAHATGRGRALREKTSDNLITQAMSTMASRAVLNFSNRISKQVQSKLDDDSSGSLLGSVPPLVEMHSFESFHDHWWSLMCSTHRPLLFYGVGSKRAPLQKFAREMARKGRCSVVVVRGEAGGRIEDIVTQLERIFSISPNLDVTRPQRMAASSAIEARVEHLLAVTNADEEAEMEHSPPPSVLLLLHNVDAPALMQEKSLRLLGLLMKSPKIHICADSVHLNVAMLNGIEITPYFHERLRWLWIDLTTYIPTLDETIGERGAGIGRTIGLPAVLDIRRAGAGSDAAALAIDSATGPSGRAGQSENGLLTERAAMHILRSVTFKARGMFLLLASKLLSISQQANRSSSSTSSAVASDKNVPPSIAYTDLAELARLNFLAMTPDALRSLLVEFTTHGLITHSTEGKVQIRMLNADLQQIVDTFASGRGE